jgi:hypothetical protein
MLTGARTQFGHSRRLNNVPYVPGDDLPVLSDESIFEGVVSAYDAVQSDVWQFTYGHSLKNTDMDMTTTHTR